MLWIWWHSWFPDIANVVGGSTLNVYRGSKNGEMNSATAFQYLLMRGAVSLGNYHHIMAYYPQANMAGGVKYLADGQSYM
jgi:hypothetical protein